MGGNDKDFLNAILQQDSLTLATFGMDEGKRSNLGCISICFWALREIPRVTDG